MTRPTSPRRASRGTPARLPLRLTELQCRSAELRAELSLIEDANVSYLTWPYSCQASLAQTVCRTDDSALAATRIELPLARQHGRPGGSRFGDPYGGVQLFDR